jgi:hypothetical protein
VVLVKIGKKGKGKQGVSEAFYWQKRVIIKEKI